MSMTESAYRVERQRQTELLHKAIEHAIHETAKGFETPMLNAAIGALICSLAGSLAAIGDPRTRKSMRKLVDTELSRQTATQVAAGAPASKTMIVEGGLH